MRHLLLILFGALGCPELPREQPENCPKYICRSIDTESIEYQANSLASCLLMPREMLKRAWHEWRDEMDPIFLPDLRAANGGYNRNEMMQSDSRK